MREVGSERGEAGLGVRLLLAMAAAAGFCLYVTVMTVLALPMLVVVALRPALRLVARRDAAYAIAREPPASERASGTVPLDGLRVVSGSAAAEGLRWTTVSPKRRFMCCRRRRSFSSTRVRDAR